jgi:hypothetical protein
VTAGGARDERAAVHLEQLAETPGAVQGGEGVINPVKDKRADRSTRIQAQQVARSLVRLALDVLEPVIGQVEAVLPYQAVPVLLRHVRQAAGRLDYH